MRLVFFILSLIMFLVGIFGLYVEYQGERIIVREPVAEFVITEEVEQITLPPIEEVLRADGIYINLEKMELVVEKDSNMRVYTIGAIRKGMKNYNTPRGDFEALYKTENHLSSYFNVWMPYSVQFEGDYFLHGYPTYNDDARTPVPYGTSGGCIRMNTSDMKEIYKLIEIGMPIIIE